MTANGISPAGGTVRLGDRTISRIGFGAMQLERLGDPGAAVDLLRRARELGADHVDTAQFYGDGAFSNEAIRAAFTPDDGVVVISKVGADPDPGKPRPIRPAQRPEQLRASVEDNLVSLGLEQIPVVNLRRLDTQPGLAAEGDQLVDLDDQLAVMTTLRDEGKIGAIGLSAVTLDVLRRALPAGIVCVQNLYGLLARDDEDLLELCTAEGIAWMPFFPLGSAFPGVPKVVDDPEVIAVARDLGRTPAQIGLAWLLHHAPNVALIPGTADAAHLEANMAVGGIELDATALTRLDAVKTHDFNILPG